MRESTMRALMFVLTVCISVSAFGEKKPKVDFSQVRIFVFTKQGNSGFVDEDLKRRNKVVEDVRDMASKGARKFGGRIDTKENMTLADSPNDAHVALEITGAGMEDLGETKT